MTGPSERRGGWRIEFGQNPRRRPGAPGGPRGPRGPLRPTGGGGNGDGDGEGPIRPPLSPEARRYALIALGIALILIAIFLRPLLHAPLMWVWRAPLPWIAALAVLGIGRLLGNRQRLTVADLQAGRYPGRGVWASSFAIAGLVFFVLQAVNPLLVQRSLAKNTEFAPVNGLPDTGVVRLVPREVAERVLTGSFNSSTERLAEPRVVNTPQGLQWISIRTPEGTVRRFTKQGGGLMLQNAQSLDRQFDQIDADFKYAPGLAVFDSLQWQLRERRLLVDLADPVGILDQAGKPLILVPYVKYKGFPIRRPVLGGAFLVHPDGRVEDLSPEEAAKRKEIAASGRLMPDTLTRRIHDAYALRGGIWNFLFLHNDQTKIVDTELNRQPYLLQGPEGRNFWVSVAEPYGKAAATNAVFVTDSTTGKTSIWKVPGSEGLTGNARAIRVTQSVAIPGVTIRTTDPRIGGSGSHRAVEPRPVFVDGKLYFVVSVIPDNAESVTKTVIINATTNRAVKVFDTDEAGLRDTLAFLEGRVSEDGEGGGADTAGDPAATTPPDAGGTTPPATQAPAGERPTEAELRSRVDEAIERQQQVLDDLRSLQRDLGTTP
ncbi:MAG: hypothetical protein JHD16_15560 [Solirubrobacteraceae bacterium]|nr:hypothetical protein [Solirubrobacteraceae bacterium]